jgi:predicted transcriptional regulator
MAAQRWAELRERKLSPEARARVDAQARSEALEMTLRSLREASGKTQDEMAELTAMSQSQLSRFERRDDYLLSTLRRYVEALGGEIEIVAVVNGKRIKLRGI